MLEDLSVAPDMDCECYETLANFNISSATLRRLTLKNWIPLVSWNEHQVVVRAPNLEYLCIDDESLSSYLLHELHSLTTVSVNIDEHSLLQDIEDFESLDAQSDRLLQFLHGITNTKFLSFSTGAIHNFNFKWIEPHCAAQCLLLHVKRIEILRFGGQKDEMELVKYLLKNGEGLNRMMIVFMNSATKKKLCQKLLRFERGSTTCEVQFL